MPSEIKNLSHVVDILKTLGKVYLSKNQYREAAEKFENIISLGVKDTDVYRHLAVALAGQKIYTPEAQGVYNWAIERFPQDRRICLHVAQAALHHRAQDEHARRFYEAALKFHPPFAKDLYLHLHYFFHAQKKYDESFQTLKQALYLERSGEDLLVMRLTQLGWHYDREEELVMTLQFLLGNNEQNLTIRRCLAFSLAHAHIRYYRTQKSGDAHFPYPALRSENDYHLLEAVLPSPSFLTTLDLVRDYCTLRLALLVATKPAKNFSAAPALPLQNENYSHPTLKAFEYRSLLDALPLEEILAGSSPLPAQTATAPGKADNGAFDWHRDFLQLLPANSSTSSDHHTENSNSLGENTALLVLAPIFQYDQSGETAFSAGSSLGETVELVKQHLAGYDSSMRILALSDGVLVFSADLNQLAMAAISVFQKLARANVLVNEKSRIVLQAALHALPPSLQAAASTSPENQSAETVQHFELLYDTLHLLEAELETPEPRAMDGTSDTHSPSPFAACSRLLMDRQRFAAVAKTGHFAAKTLGPAYWGAPGWRDKVCEIIWYNPLDYASEKKPYALGRFLVLEKIADQRTYGTYRTRDHSLERPVILKALHPAIQVQRRQKESQHTEMVNRIRRLGRLEHPGIAVIYDLGFHEDIFYLVREYIEGENLAQTLANKRILPPAEAVRLLIEVCRTLRYAHQNGVYHGNLNPSNIWELRMAVTKDFFSARALLAPPVAQFEKIPMNIKISDFFIPGFNEISATNWHYAPPELLFLKKADPVNTFQATVDVYALGMILYDCVCPENPFKQIEFPTSRSSWKKVQLTSLAVTNMDAPDQGMLPVLEEIIRRATHRDPLQRFQTLDALEAVLRQALRQPLALIHKPINWLSKAE